MSTISPGDLVIFKRNGDKRTLGRVLRVFIAPKHRWGGWRNDKDEDVEYGEILPLVNLDTMATTRSYENGNWTHEIQTADLTPLTDEARREIQDDILNRLQRVNNAIRMYESTTEQDPKFTVPKTSLQGRARAVGCPETANTAEMLSAVYGKCYANPHLKCKVQ